MSQTEQKPLKSAIEAKLCSQLHPLRLAVLDQSHLHAGHLGQGAAHEETHFSVEIVSAAFAGKTRLERHRLVNDILSSELSGSVHALSLVAKAPDEVS